jgi:hypothetical protein
LAKNKREFIVEGTPDVVLEIVWDFFESNKWPYPMKRDRSFLYEDRRPSRFVVSKPGKLETPLRFFGFAKRINVTAVRDEAGWTKLTVKASKAEHAETLAAWIQRELIENKAATRAESPS